jgi:GT2 family glycosyltransferase
MRIAAVTVNWNQWELTRQCLDSLLAGSQVPAWTIVVDNGSRGDGSSELRGCTHAIVLRNQRNVGFAAGANSGIERALALGAEAVLVVNNDAVVAAHCIAELQAALEADDGLAGVGGKTLTQERPPRIHTAYGVLTYHGQLVRQQGWMEPDVAQFSTQTDADYISGCAMLLRRSALERVGLLDPEFFAYHEDLDWCVRARRAGYRVAYVPRALVYHHMHASTRGGGYLSPITYLSARNGILFVRKHASVAERLKYAVYLCGNLLREGVLRYRRGEMAGFKLRLCGLRDGLLRRPVPLGALGLDSVPGVAANSREGGVAES